MLAEALAAGAAIVTPNNRLAREIALRFDTARAAEGRHAWESAQVLPWTMWLERLRLAAIAVHASGARTLELIGSSTSPLEVVERDARIALVDARGRIAADGDREAGAARASPPRRAPRRARAAPGRSTATSRKN